MNRLLTTIVFFNCLTAFGLSEDKYGVFKKSEFSTSDSPVAVSWYSKESRQRFERAEIKNDFYQLAPNYQPQINPLYCGMASATILLNAFRLSKGVVSQPKHEVEKPKVMGGGKIPFPLFTQDTLLNEKTDRVKDRLKIELKNITPENTDNEKAFGPGVSLSQLKGVLEAYGLKADAYEASDKSSDAVVSKFREMVKKVLNDEDNFILINFKGATLGAATGGHISPLGAYDSKSDSVLILDVASHKNPWYWIPVSYLYKAMNTKDGDKFRGYVVVKDPT